jgi:CheY-like chemotaxis protein/two-component sensor histidine kinase
VPDAQDLTDGLEVIERNARAQTQIIEDLLDMSRIINGKVHLDIRPVELSTVIDAALETVHPAAHAKGLRIALVLDPSTGTVLGDPNRLQQILWNLLSNAVKFTPRGGRVEVKLERAESHVQVSVTDTGEGIHPDFLPQVFDRFSQADASTTRAHGGLGLGLAIVKHLIELHGGTISVDSEGPGKGSTFAVRLPLKIARDVPVVARERKTPDVQRIAVPRGDECPELDGVKVLVVDDEPDARALVKRLLENCRATVLTASNATDALDLVRRDRPDVLVSDIGMPGLDGFALIRQLRSLGHNEGGTTPAIAMTAYARSEDRIRAIQQGFQIHIAKPIEPAELVAMVASLAGTTTAPVRDA